MTTKDTGGATVDEAENALLRAMLDSDVSALAQLLNEALTFQLPDGSTVDREADLAAHRDGATRFESIVELKRSTQEHQGRARTVSLVELEVRDHGEYIRASMQYERNWAIIDGRWQVTSGRATPVTSVAGDSAPLRP